MSQQPPMIDGHLWVVRDGKIIDPHFQSYNNICMIRGVDVKKPVYIPADEIIQKVILGMWKKFWDTNDFDEIVEMWENQVNMCFVNAIVEQKKNGGELVFGSFGWEDWIEYGGKDWKLRQFLKK